MAQVDLQQELRDYFGQLGIDPNELWFLVGESNDLEVIQSAYLKETLFHNNPAITFKMVDSENVLTVETIIQ